MTMKSVDLPHLRSVVLAGHAGSGKTTLAEQLLFNAGAIPRLGRVDDGTRPSRLRARGAEAARVAEPRGRDVRVRRDADLAGRHARLPGLRRRGDRGVRRRRRRAVRDGRVGRRRGRPRAGRRPGPHDRDGGLLLHQQVRPRERRPDRGARCAAGGLRRQDRAAPARDRRRRLVQRLRRPRPPQGVQLGRHGRGRDPDPATSWPTRSRRGGTSSSAPRPRPTTTCWPSTSTARRSPTPSSRPACARASRRASSRRSWSGRRRRASGCAALLDAIVRYLPSPADEAAGHGDSTRAAPRSRSRPTRTVRCSSACSRPRPTRSSGG